MAFGNTTEEETAVAQAVARARDAFPQWAGLSVAERCRRMAPTKDRLLDRAQAVAECVHEEIGKPAVEALLGEVLPSADVVQYWTLMIAELLDPRPVELDALAYPKKSGTIHLEPRGVVAIITPYNFPIALPLRTIVPALLAGNTVVLKPSEVAARSGSLIADLFDGLLPSGVFSVVRGAARAGAALCNADVDLVAFTGSVATGRKVAHACAERLIPCVLELGGKDAAIVLGDADIQRAANGIVWGAMMNAGQNCASVERVFVEREISEAFISAACAAAASLTAGTDFGPLATEGQREIVRRHVEGAVAQGAQVLLGGPSDAAGGRNIPPTVLRVASDESDLMREETFGPILPIAVVDGEEEAIRRTNATSLGLTASVWTRNVKRGLRVAQRLRAGVVTVNNHGFTGAIPAAPWSGRGETGWGITSSPLALDALTRPRFVLVDRNKKRRELWWFPYTPALSRVASSMAILRSSKQSIVARLRALGAFVRALLTRLREL